jgi:hypothetical protein
MANRANKKVKVILRPTVNRSVRLGVRHPFGTRDQFLFLFEIFFRELRVCYFVMTSLTRGQVSVSLGSQSRRTQGQILLSQFLRLPQPWGSGPRILSRRNRAAQLYPRALGSRSFACYDSQGYGGGILSRLHTGNADKGCFIADDDYYENVN